MPPVDKLNQFGTWEPTRSRPDLWLDWYGDHITQSYSQIDRTKERLNDFKTYSSVKSAESLIIKSKILFDLLVMLLIW